MEEDDLDSQALGPQVEVCPDRYRGDRMRGRRPCRQRRGRLQVVRNEQRNRHVEVRMISRGTGNRSTGVGLVADFHRLMAAPIGLGARRCVTRWRCAAHICFRPIRGCGVIAAAGRLARHVHHFAHEHCPSLQRAGCQQQQQEAAHQGRMAGHDVKVAANGLAVTEAVATCSLHRWSGVPVPGLQDAAPSLHYACASRVRAAVLIRPVRCLHTCIGG